VSENWFDLHVLCAPDIPWEPDKLRENPEDRDALFLRYVETLEKMRKPYLIVEGSLDKRLKKVSKAIRQLQRNS
jgi:nicotinamide riboside kinase